MNGMNRTSTHLANLDLNLLVALRELIGERNVTRAAERMGVTQPAASAALSRLRRHFDDDLLVRSKGEYVLTPLARQLAEQVDAVCAAAERLFATSTHFDPATSQREFTLLMADYTIAAMGEGLSRLVESTAPQTRLHVKLVREALGTDYAENIRFIDGVVAPVVSSFQVPDTRSVELFRDRWVCVISTENRAVDPQALCMADLARLPWVAPYHRDHGDASAAPITRQLALLGIRPRIAVRVESYLAVPYFVAGTDRIALMQERLAAKYADRLGLRVVECPAELEPIVEALWWHEYYENDPAHVWLRRLLTRAAPADDPSSGETGPGSGEPGRSVRTQALSTVFMGSR